MGNQLMLMFVGSSGEDEPAGNSQYIITEASDYITTEAGDRLITEG